jgi:hypothetical protein
MVHLVPADELLRSARHAAGKRNVRDAVRDLTLHALRSRPLTARHIAVVARTVGEGIESSEVAPGEPGRETHRGAWAGLEDAVGEALRAVELAAKGLGEGNATLTQAERDRTLAEIADMERMLGEGWDRSHTIPATLRARIASVTSLLARTPARDASAPEGDARDNSALSFVASGVLLGLSEGSPRPG